MSLKKITFYSITILLIIIICLIIFALFFRAENPVDRLNYTYSIEKIDTLNSKNITTQAGEKRWYYTVQLTDTISSLRPKFSISVPDSMIESLSIVFAIGGLSHGETYLNLIPQHGDNLIIGFHYPNNSPKWEDQLQLSNIFHISESMNQVPIHATMIMDYILKTHSIDTNRVNFISYSLGALFAPSILNIAQSHDIHFSSSTIVYGSSNIEGLIDHNMKVDIPIIKRFLVWVLSSPISAIEPNHHISKLKGPFHIINGELDKKIPIEMAKIMQHDFPEPKFIQNIPEKHMHSKRVALTKKLVKMTFDWLLAKKFIQDVNEKVFID